MGKINEQRYGPFDVLVAGGGLAGIAAAIAAGRAGAKTLLVEQAGWLGGMGITGATGLHSFFNIFGACQGAGRFRLVAGVPQDLVDRCDKLGGAVGHVLMERGGDFVSMLTPVEPEAFKLAACQLCLEAGVTLLLHTMVEEVVAAEGHVEGVTVWNKAGRSRIRAEQFIDCTGDGDLAAFAGAPFEHFAATDEGAYSAGFTFRLCNVDLQALEAGCEKRGWITQLAHAVKPGGRSPDLVRMGLAFVGCDEVATLGVPGYFLSSSVRPRELTYCNCINHGPNDGLSPADLTDAEVDLRGKMFDVASFFKQHVPGCEDSYPAGPAPSAGQRRARAIRCDYELSVADCTDGRQFDDQIGVFGFIDNGRYFVKEAGAYGIPYPALLPKDLDNVLIAGRMMSVPTVVHNTTRNTVCCMICGQAAGTAAALAAGAGVTPRDLDVSKLRDKLRADGAILSPASEPLAGAAV